MGKLNLKQKKFADEYLICSNATESAIKAGYSEKTAYSIGQRLLKKVEVKVYIDEKLKKLESEKIADVKEIMEHLTKVMRGEETEETIVIEGQGDGISKARKVSKEVSPKDRLKAAELLGKRYNLFTDKIEQTTDIKPIVIRGDDELEE